MPDHYQLRDVFSRGMPTVTYVKREHLGLERELRQSTAKGFAIIAVTGPSKCGKTVLRRTVIPDNVVVHIEGGQVDSEVDFWETIRSHLELPTSETTAASKKVGGSAGISVSVGAPGARATGTYGEADEYAKSGTRTFNGAQKVSY